MTTPVYNPGQPFVQNIPGGFSAGKIAHITGTFTPTASSIVIKLQSGMHGDPSDNVGLCMYGRHHESLLGLNSFSKTVGWGQEEVKQTRFLTSGSQFDITILCDPTQFKIAINREHFSEFNHRLNPAELNHLNIVSGANDVVINCIWIEDQSGMNNSSHSGFVAAPSHQADPYASGPHYGSSSTQQYASADHHGNKSKGLLGMVSGAGAAVAGALGASHLLGSKGRNYGYSSHGQGGYPSSSHQGYGHSNMMGGNVVNKALGVGTGLMAAKTVKKGLGGGNMLKYGLPLAGVGLGGYALTKGLSHSFDFDNSFDDDCCCDSD